jgi:hypothetical protein
VTGVVSPLVRSMEGIRVGDGGAHGTVGRSGSGGWCGSHDLTCWRSLATPGGPRAGSTWSWAAQ